MLLSLSKSKMCNAINSNLYKLYYLRRNFLLWNLLNYYETCEKTIKEQCNNHTAAFKNKSKQKIRELSKHIWELKGNSIQ